MMRMCVLLTVIVILCAAALADIERNVLLPPGPENPRNSEGDFVQLRDGRVMFIYTHFTGGRSDHASAHLAARFSADGGRTWTADDQLVVANEGGMNVMSVSLLRLADGRIALFYLRKNSTSDCRPLVRFSGDEAKTWTEPRECVTDEVGYYVMNNDRAVQLASGRIVLPLALHKNDAGAFTGHGRAMCYLSDDGGQTFRRQAGPMLELIEDPADTTGLQEPGVVELRDGRLMMFIRTNKGSQYLSFSSDRGETWSPAAPSGLRSPRSPASIERVPSTGDLLALWNDHRPPAPGTPGIDPKKRTPLSAAISRDDGKTWQPSKLLESNPGGWYCYTAIEFIGDHILLAHCAGQQTPGAPGGAGLATTQITRLPVRMFYD